MIHIIHIYIYTHIYIIYVYIYIYVYILHKLLATKEKWTSAVKVNLLFLSGDKDDNCWCRKILCNPFGVHHYSCRWFLVHQERSKIHIRCLHRIAQKKIVLRARTWREDVIGEGGLQSNVYNYFTITQEIDPPDKRKMWLGYGNGRRAQLFAIQIIINENQRDFHISWLI